MRAEYFLDTLNILSLHKDARGKFTAATVKISIINQRHQAGVGRYVCNVISYILMKMVTCGCTWSTFHLCLMKQPGEREKLETILILKRLETTYFAIGQTVNQVISFVFGYEVGYFYGSRRPL